ncbi:MAG: hypothetical protein QM493_08420 [Sulfurovum sp.]
MKISFDIDDTLILYNKGDYASDRLLNGEYLRDGTIFLLKELAKKHELWIYTSSFRTPFLLKFYFWLKGVKIKRVINQDIHNKILKEYNFSTVPSKLPSHFDIDVHIDDSDGVVQEGEIFGFNVIQVRPSQENWKEIILDSIEVF